MTSAYFRPIFTPSLYHYLEAPTPPVRDCQHLYDPPPQPVSSVNIWEKTCLEQAGAELCQAQHSLSFNLDTD